MIGKGEDYTTGSLLDYNYFNKHYKLVVVDLSKQKELIQLFIGNSKNLKKLY